MINALFGGYGTENLSRRHLAISIHRMAIVEDHDTTRKALRGIFEMMGWQVSEVMTVADALKFLDARPEPCCMLLDLDLPDGRGETVLAKLREMNLKTRVVVASGMCDPVRLKAVLDLKPDAFMPKPITVEAVWEGICRVCGDD